MSFTVKTKNGKKLIEGKYIPDGFTCKCKECSYTIEVPECTTDDQIRELVNLIQLL